MSWNGFFIFRKNAILVSRLGASGLLGGLGEEIRAIWDSREIRFSNNYHSCCIRERRHRLDRYTFFKRELKYFDSCQI
jgi:hypothetical protein